MPGLTGKDQVLTDYANKLAVLDAPKGRSLTQDALRRLSKNKAAVVSIGIVVLIIRHRVAAPDMLEARGQQHVRVWKNLMRVRSIR